MCASSSILLPLSVWVGSLEVEAKDIDYYVQAAQSRHDI